MTVDHEIRIADGVARAIVPYAWPVFDEAHDSHEAVWCIADMSAVVEGSCDADGKRIRGQLWFRSGNFLYLFPDQYKPIRDVFLRTK